MPTFCRHNRFVERCPICSRTLPGAQPSGDGERRATRGSGAGSGAGAGAQSGSYAQTTTRARSRRQSSGERRSAAGHELRVQRETRAAEDGYSSDLLPGLRASADAERLAAEVAFASGRLARMHTHPPGLFGEIQALAAQGSDGLERATWICFLTVYLSPLQGDDPFAGVRSVLERERVLIEGRAMSAGGPAGERPGVETATRDWDSPLDGVPLGPRTSHDPARGSETLRAYRQWALNSGTQVEAIVGDEAWTPTRRFDRAFERLGLPGFGRMGRYELLVTLGRLGLYELQAGTLHLAAGRGAAADDLTTLAAKRIFAVGDPIYLERRALALALALSVPVDALDLAFANWAAGERATLGFGGDDVLDEQALARARDALGL